jgi:hypothetical protein
LQLKRKITVAVKGHFSLSKNFRKTGKLTIGLISRKIFKIRKDEDEQAKNCIYHGRKE